MLLPDVRRELEKLEAALQGAVLDSLERDLDASSSRAVQLEVDGRTYFRMPLADAVQALFRPLTPDEVRDRVARGVIDDEPTPVYMVFALERSHGKDAS